MHLGFLLSLPHTSLFSIFVLELSLARFYLCSWARACTTFVKCNICCYPPSLLSLLYSSLSSVILFHRKKRNTERKEFLKGNTDTERVTETDRAIPSPFIWTPCVRLWQAGRCWWHEEENRGTEKIRKIGPFFFSQYKVWGFRWKPSLTEIRLK